ncbi:MULTISPECIES: tripartite tricarboxylate transporter TctB family protein [Paenibacillus]|uniref:tripartite tricarboxylate transporter TctB family protein n=1 Tax=Paenibacillus TaxID=44249 RepID=UPI0006CF5299|nr:MULTISPECIES: tripartite tricarboxylate transporter TctB family protein [Paenibacillus]GCL70822.1 tripartite tricarboxylate transporter TctB family protein [Paenibacillus naphthalenovorans]
MNKTVDRYASLVFLAIGAVFMYKSSQLAAQSSIDTSVGPNVFPFGLGFVLVLLSFRLLYETFQYKGESKKKTAALDYKRFGIILAATILYVLLLEVLGYVICTFIFLLIGFQTMERGKWFRSVLISVFFSFGLYYLYVEVLEGTLPGLPSWMGI